MVLAVRVWLQGCRILLAGYWVLHANARPPARVRVALDPGEFGLPAPAPEYGVRAQHCAAHMIT